MIGRLFVTLTASMLIAQPAISANKRFFPHGCRQTGFEFFNHQLTLMREPVTVEKSQDETLYLIYNKSHHNLVLKTDADSRYLPNYKKTILPQHWAVFARTDKQLTFRCSTALQHEHSVSFDIDCYEAIALCNYNHAKFPPQNIGTYWLQRTSPNQRTMMRIAIKKGILLRW